MDELIISEKLIFNDMSGSFSQIIRTVSKKLQNMGIVKSSYPEAVIEREKEYPTGLEGLYGNFAIPHTYSEHCIQSALVIIRTSRPMEFVRMDDHGQKIKCELMVLLAISRPEQQLIMLRRLMKAMQNKKVFHILKDEVSGEVVAETLREICL